MESLNDFPEELITDCMNQYVNIWYILRRPWLFPFALTNFNFTNCKANTNKLCSNLGFIFSPLVWHLERFMSSVLHYNSIGGIVNGMYDEGLRNTQVRAIKEHPFCIKDIESFRKGKIYLQNYS